eukprot:GHVN01026812.1.p1 GENE.GHVN01026812.1~~GHVN01026812.1.p1  ORF type:complete len:133 (-),score=54.43 GHVN01026812.1:406-804(-)
MTRTKQSSRKSKQPKPVCPTTTDESNIVNTTNTTENESQEGEATTGGHQLQEKQTAEWKEMKKEVRRLKEERKKLKKKKSVGEKAAVREINKSMRIMKKEMTQKHTQEKGALKVEDVSEVKGEGKGGDVVMD